MTSSDTARLAHRAQRHQQQRRLADTGLAADEHERRRDEAAAEHAVELGDAGRDALGLGGVDVDEPQQRLRRRDAAGTSGGPSSTSVPNASQPGHLPNQRPAV